MFLKRTGFPEESELVLCTVTNIQHNSVFVNIHEYNRQGMITISEIAPGRIRNIRDYVIEGKVIVCKILYINKERGYIDLSLRRVSEGQRRQKNDEIKQEMKAEKIIEMSAHVLGVPVAELYNKIADKLMSQYFYIFQAFDDVINGTISLESYFDKNLSQTLEKSIRDKIKAKEIAVAGDLSISVYEENGLDIVKNALLSALKDTSRTTISYLGGGKYRILVKGTEYKQVEKILKDASDTAISLIKKNKGKIEYTRVKNLSMESAA
jgi:translation initiation factor 2 subunit 1